ncbi:MAG: HNH endonuclease [Chitinophagaceae bacterium]|nr:HNH endonuclease [Chitinophagaceae bacterium]
MGFVCLKISKGLETIIDVDSYNFLIKNNNLKWNAQKCGNRYYVSKNKLNKKIYLHRYIMDCPDGFCIDHINGDSLDNRKENLRICSFRENSRNLIKDVFKGVTKTKNGKYQAQITYNNNHVTLGVFSSESEAARVYDIAAALLFKEYAALNFAFSKKFIKLVAGE